MNAYPRGMGDHITLGPFHGHEYPSEATLARSYTWWPGKDE